MYYITQLYNNNIHLLSYNDFTLSSYSHLKASSDFPFYLNKTLNSKLHHDLSPAYLFISS